MPLQLLLLLTLLGPGSSHLQRESGIPGPPLTRARRDLNEELGFTADEDYEIIGTDPPEMIENSTWALSQNSEPQAVMGTVEQRVSVGPGTPEPATVGSAGLDAGTATMGNPDTELTTQGIPATQGSLIVEPATEISSMTEAPTREGAPSMEPATMEALSTEPATTEALSTEPTTTEALSTEPTATEALSTEPITTEALSTEPATTEALSTEPATTEALSTEPITTEALSTEPAATEGSFVEPSATVVLSTEATTTEATSTEPATTRGPATSLLVTSDLHYDTTVAPNNASNVFIHQRKDRQGLWSRSSVAPGLTRVPDRVPVKQCLLAILILALVATIFLVCTVVLAIRLSRKTHTYPVRNYSPTEMVCISSLLPDGAEAPAPTANGRLPKAKSQGPQADREGDDLTLQSFLP
ncbi:P-selectin glycoprotein ligand 1 [Dasypus novemcinctus]|uniref:P-selectin glycoprotein ligand 1 n=1 Tax=Dasypus novemcinctus TaxID=9361 RepID=UPI00265FFB6C|nr:P-selectin glycoprotein ligand 1 [Dasypus novemcinctus]